MQTKKLVFNSDDFGASKAFNLGIQKGFDAGVLTSTCILANGVAFESGVEEILPQMDGIGIGVHLNIIEGKSLTNPSMLCDSSGEFNNGFSQILMKSYDKRFITQVEAEFRAQIEKILRKTPVDHINSHVHTHAITNIFSLTCDLAKEYGIKCVRTQFEHPYFIPNLKKHLSPKYPVNLIKVALLNHYSARNKIKARANDFITNDYILGVTYTGYMDEDAIVYGLKSIKKDCLTEILIHPTFYDEGQVLKPFNYGEYMLTQSPTIKERIEEQGWTLTNYQQIASTPKEELCC